MIVSYSRYFRMKNNDVVECWLVMIEVQVKLTLVHSWMLGKLSSAESGLCIGILDNQVMNYVII